MLRIQLVRQRKELRQIGEAHCRTVDLAAADRHQLQLDPTDNAGQTEAANAGGEKLRILHG